jgi:hypothetical protein
LDGEEVECYGQEADGYVEDLTRDFVFVDLESLVSMRAVGERCGKHTKERHFWCMGIRPRGLGERLISRQ